jgi:hypothetical protein
LNKEIPMCNFNDLRSVLAKSGTTLFTALFIAVIGVGSPASDVVAQVQGVQMQDNQVESIELQQNRQSEFNPSEIDPTEVKPTEINATEIKPTEINATEIKPTEINATEIKPTEINATEIKPTEITPTEITPKQDDIFVDNAGSSPAAPASAGGASSMGPMILVGGVAVAGAAALAVGLSTATGTGVDCGAAPQGFGGAWFAQYSEWCSCMGGTASTANGVECIR